MLSRHVPAWEQDLILKLNFYKMGGFLMSYQPTYITWRNITSWHIHLVILHANMRSAFRGNWNDMVYFCLTWLQRIWPSLSSHFSLNGTVGAGQLTVVSVTSCAGEQPRYSGGARDHSHHSQVGDAIPLATWPSLLDLTVTLRRLFTESTNSGTS